MPLCNSALATFKEHAPMSKKAPELVVNVPATVIPVDVAVHVLLVLVIEKLLKKLPPLFIDWVPDPLKVIVPLLWVNVPLFVKLPEMVILPVVEVSVPVLMVRLPKVALPVPKCNVPDPILVKSCPPDIPADTKVTEPGVLMLLGLDKVIAPL